jgi:hypothetical protein
MHYKLSYVFNLIIPIRKHTYVSPNFPTNLNRRGCTFPDGRKQVSHFNRPTICPWVPLQPPNNMSLRTIYPTSPTSTILQYIRGNYISHVSNSTVQQYISGNYISHVSHFNCPTPYSWELYTSTSVTSTVQKYVRGNSISHTSPTSTVLQYIRGNYISPHVSHFNCSAIYSWEPYLPTRLPLQLSNNMFVGTIYPTLTLEIYFTEIIWQQN